MAASKTYVDPEKLEIFCEAYEIEFMLKERTRFSWNPEQYEGIAIFSDGGSKLTEDRGFRLATELSVRLSAENDSQTYIFVTDSGTLYGKMRAWHGENSQKTNSAP